MIKTITMLDDACECGRTSRCAVHMNGKKTEMTIRTKLYVCANHFNGLEINTTGMNVYPASSFIESYSCQVARCNFKAFAAFDLYLEGIFSQQ